MGVAVGTAALLFAMGRSATCACGSLVPWAGDIWSRHQSQHLLDPYSFTHVLHGVMYYALLWPLRGRLSLPTRALCAVGFAAVWEVVENSSYVIERYRAVTISLDYYGDSVLNAAADVACCAAGFALTARLPAWAGWAFFLGVEAALLVWIRDSLLVNIVMLAVPIEAIKQWQMGGH